MTNPSRHYRLALAALKQQRSKYAPEAYNARRYGVRTGELATARKRYDELTKAIEFFESEMNNLPRKESL